MDIDQQQAETRDYQLVVGMLRDLNDNLKIVASRGEQLLEKMSDQEAMLIQTRENTSRALNVLSARVYDLDYEQRQGVLHAQRRWLWLSAAAIVTLLILTVIGGLLVWRIW